MGTRKWSETSYLRCLVDMHIEDWDPRFLSRFDPTEYVRLMKAARAQSIMFYANSHVGLCNWPTSTGRMHGGLGGKDAVGEITRQCRKEGIGIVLYFSVVFDNWAYDHDPSWRIIGVDGRTSREGACDDEGYGRRYGLVCPNTGYRDYAAAQVEELCRRYEFEGMFFDMTFWPTVCYCPSCQARFARELGGEMPRVIDWADPRWREFQKKREDWITEFTDLLTSTVKTIKPAATVSHQLASIKGPWRYGITDRVLGLNDYAAGDFYGGWLQHSFIAKLYYNATSSLPFEMHTSARCSGLGDHTTMKPLETLETNACLYFAHRGAFNAIDAIDPEGTLNPQTYEALGRVYETLRSFVPHIGGELCQDVGVYFSFLSKKDLRESGRKVTAYTYEFPHLMAALGASRTLKESHIPFGVLCRKNLGQLSHHRVLVLPDVLELDAEEERAMLEFVAGGGCLYASGNAALTGLARALGITQQGETKERVTYFTPTPEGATLMPEVRPEYPLTINDAQMILATADPGSVLATLTLPYTDPADNSRFASIHSNPPGVHTSHPAIIRLRHGKGTVLWAAAPLERAEQPLHRSIFARMVRSLAPGPFSFEVDAPAAVEVTLFHQPDKRRFIVNLVNEQEEAPPIPVSGVRVRVRTAGRGACKATLLPEETPLATHQRDSFTEIEIPPIGVYRMVALAYGKGS